MWWIVAIAVAQPPVLLDPDAARLDAAALVRNATSAPALLRGAETLFLARDMDGARAALAKVGDGVDPARKERLALDIAVSTRDPSALAVATELVTRPGWSTHANRQALVLEEAKRDARIASYGRVLLALSLAVLLIGGARELLVPRKATWTFLAVVVVATAMTAWVSLLLAQLLAMVDLAALVLVHAGAATIRRVQPAAKGRVFVAVLVLIGCAGAVLAVLAPIPWAFVLEQTAR